MCSASSKVCSKCGQRKLADEFDTRPERPVGLASSCRECKAAFRKQRYRERRKHDPINLWITNATNWSKSRAKNCGVRHALTREDVAKLLAGSDHRCVYCGKTFNFRRTIKTRRDSPTLDRILPQAGYTVKNTTICCFRCNMIKNEASLEDLQQIVAVVKRLMKSRDLR
jgi:hypothetical protein